MLAFKNTKRGTRSSNKGDIIHEKIFGETYKLRPRYKKQEVKGD